MFEELLARVLHNATVMIIGIVALLVLLLIWDIWTSWAQVGRGR